MAYKTTFLICVFCLKSIFLQLGYATEWTYPDRETNETDPKWGGICDTGKHQSPIELNALQSFKGRFEDFVLRGYETSLSGASFINTGHSVQITVPENVTIEIRGGGLPGTFTLVQMHWHWWSEHKMENLRYPLELHMVHRNTFYTNMSEAVKYEDGVAVFGVLFHITDKIYQPLSNILDSLPLIESIVGTSTAFHKDFSPMDFFPKDITRYYRYQGSLTTPDCAESVVWTVFPDTIPVTYDQVKQFMFVRRPDGKLLKTNYRSIQGSFNRAVIYVEPEDNVKEIDTNSANILFYPGAPLLIALYVLVISF